MHTKQLIAVVLLCCCCFARGKGTEISMTMKLSCGKDVDQEPIKSQPTCNCNATNETHIALQKVTEELKSQVQQLKHALQLTNQASVGSSFCSAGDSCKEIKLKNPKAKDGRYWVDIDGPRKVYCDMTTDGGGWMLVSNVVSDATQGKALTLANDFKKISEYSSNSLALSGSALATLQNLLHFKQIRFFCHKKVPGRTINIATNDSVTGKPVVQYFMGRTDHLPTACGSFYKMADDNSLLSQQCSQWGYDGSYRVNRWGHLNIPKLQRLFNHPFFEVVKYHFLVESAQNGRWECDDFHGTLSVGDTWKILVR